MHHITSAVVTQKTKNPISISGLWCVMNYTCFLFLRAVCCRVWAFPRLAVSRHAVCTLLLGVCCTVEQRPWGTRSATLLWRIISITLLLLYYYSEPIPPKAKVKLSSGVWVWAVADWNPVVSVGGEKLLPGGGISEVGLQSTHPTRWSRAFKNVMEGSNDVFLQGFLQS